MRRQCVGGAAHSGGVIPAADRRAGVARVRLPAARAASTCGCTLGPLRRGGGDPAWCVRPRRVDLAGDVDRRTVPRPGTWPCAATASTRRRGVPAPSARWPDVPTCSARATTRAGSTRRCTPWSATPTARRPGAADPAVGQRARGARARRSSSRRWSGSTPRRRGAGSCGSTARPPPARRRPRCGCRRPPTAGARCRSGTGGARASRRRGRARCCGPRPSRSRLQEGADLPIEEARRRLLTVRGIGPWTVAEVASRALGDADAVSVGDYHLAHLVGWALTGPAHRRRRDAAPARAVGRPSAARHPAHRDHPDRDGTPVRTPRAAGPTAALRKLLAGSCRSGAPAGSSIR